jgi:retron-type reverse transcriptase
LIQFSRQHKKGGGVAIYVHESIEFKNVVCNNDDSLTIISMLVKFNAQWSKFIAYYKTPTVNLNTFLDAIECEIDNHLNCFLCGDSNINTSTNNPQTISFLQMLNNYNAFVCNSFATRPAASTIIDHIISKGIEIVKIDMIATNLSDHNIIVASLPGALVSNFGSQHIKRRIVEYDKVIEELDKTLDLRVIQSLPNPNEQLTYIAESLLQAVEVCTTIRVFKIKGSSVIPHYITTNILNMMTHAQNISNKIRNRRRALLPFTKLQSKLMGIENEITNRTVAAYKSHYNNIFSNASLKRQWSAINELIGNNRKTVKLTFNSLTYDNDESISNAINNHFTAIATASRDESKLLEIYNKYNTIKLDQPNSMFFSPVETNEIVDIIMSLDSSKSPGFDGITAKELKASMPTISEALTLLVNRIIETASYPAELKLAKVSVVPKANFKGDLNDTRPISVLPTINKVIESVIKGRLQQFLSKTNEMDTYQFGFRENSGTDLAIAELLNNILFALDNNQVAGVLFFDISKAFDSVPHSLLFEKINRLGIRGHTLQLLQSYFSGRRQAVHLNNVTSNSTHITQGTPQGANISPLLFNLFLDDFKRLPLIGKVFRFADDSCVFLAAKVDDIVNLSDSMQHDAVLVEDFHAINGLQLNRKKSEFILFRRKNSPIDTATINMIEEKIGIKNVVSHRHLGFIFHENGSISPHIAHTESKMRPGLNVLSKLKWILPHNTLMKIYYAHVHAHLVYLASTLELANKQQMNQLQVLQKRALRHVFHLPVDYSSKDLFCLFAQRVLPLKAIVVSSSCVLIHKIVKEKIISNLQFKVNENGLRNNGSLIPSTYKRAAYMACDITCAGVKHYNLLPADIRVIDDIEIFKVKLKQYLLDNISKFL